MVDSVNDSLPTDFTIDGNLDHTSGTVLEVCVAAKVDDDMGDDSCIFVFFADTWEIPDCNVPDQPQLPKLDPGHAYHLPSNWNLGDEEQTWFLALSLKANDPAYSPTNIVTFEHYTVRAEGLSQSPPAGDEPAPPQKTRWTLQATEQTGNQVTDSVDVEISGNAFQRLHIEQTASVTLIYISDTNGEQMETLFEGDPAELGKAISLGKTATIPNQGNVPFLLGHLLTTVNDDLYRYKMEEVAAGATSIAALTTQGDTIVGYNIDTVNKMTILTRFQ